MRCVMYNNVVVTCGDYVTYRITFVCTCVYNEYTAKRVWIWWNNMHKHNVMCNHNVMCRLT